MYVIHREERERDGEGGMEREKEGGREEERETKLCIHYVCTCKITCLVLT